MRVDGSSKHEIQPAEAGSDVHWDDFAIARESPLFAIGAVNKEQNGSVEVWSTESNEKTRAPGPAKTSPATSKVNNFKTAESVRTIACSEDGNLVAVANGNPTLMMLENGNSRVKDNWKPSAEFLDVQTGKSVVSLKLTTTAEDAVLAATERVSHFEVTALAVSPDGSIVAVGTSIGQVKLYRARTGELLRLLDDQPAKLADKKTPGNWKPLARAMGSVESLAFSPDGSLLAMCGSSFPDYSRIFDKSERLDERSTGPGRLKIWDVQTGRLVHDLVGHSVASAVSFSPDGSLLASAGSWLSDAETGTGVVVWNARAGTKLRTISIEANGGTHSMAFSPDGKLMAIGSLHFDKDKVDDAGTSIISLAHAASGVVQWRRTKSGPTEPVAFFDGAVVALSGGQSLWCFDVDDGKILTQLTRTADTNQGGRWNDFAFAKQGPMWVIGGADAERRGIVEILSSGQP